MSKYDLDKRAVSGIDSPEGRGEFELLRLADPRTGEIPANIYSRELEYAATLPKYDANGKSGVQEFNHVGPFNVGGRTRALAIDVSNPTVYFAGGVSGGMWRTNNEGLTWFKVSHPDDHAAVSCIVQDTRIGKEDIWYYGSGESIGNSASKSFSAYYRGSGIYKSVDKGISWKVLANTTTKVNKATDWDVIYALATDPSRNDSDIVYAALKTGIFRSNDGGSNWKHVLLTSSNASFTDIKVSPKGVAYATISSNAGTGKGFWRSANGLNWSKITASNFPSSYVRTVLDIAPSNENLVFFF